LFLEIEVETDPVFTREGSDLLVRVKVPFSGVCLGASVEVPTLEGSKRVKVPPGMAGGGKIRLKGFGVPHRGKGTKGDLYAVIEVAVPSTLTPAQKDLAEKLREAGL
jgi:curved DNA-binding protein